MLKKAAVRSEVILSDRGSSTVISRMVKAGLARKLGPKLYTRNMVDPLEAIVARNLWPIVAMLMPESIVSHRTAFENRAAPDGSVFLSAAYPRRIKLPGIILRQVKGPGPAPGDMPYMGSLYLASRPRAFLENLLPSRGRDAVAKTVGRKEVERRLAELLRISGEDALNRLRDEARKTAPELGLQEQFRMLDGMIGALLRTRTGRLKTPSAGAYAAGEPYDPTRLPVFEALFTDLRNGAWSRRPDNAREPPAFFNAAFFDAYFSNYIEGTEFPVDQAIRIVFEGEIPAGRPADAHDVLGTYRLVGSQDEMRLRPRDFEDFLTLLRRRHATVMEGRPDKLPGQFKTEDNQAGGTLFVSRDLVPGTLHQGFGMYQALDEPFARALFMMFLVAEVHPFMDGNGRMARVMMNAELIAAGATRIIVPTVYRTEYVGSLRRLTNHQDPLSFTRVMDVAQLFVHRTDFTDLDCARRFLARHNAFHDPADDVKLRMPEEGEEIA
ncbi:MAG: Fic family protein [Terriglobia bacterium]